MVMRETPGSREGAYMREYRRRDLRRFRYHTGAPLLPLWPDEACPVLFRDLGLDGMALYLGGKLRRLAGPPSPITYMRTCAYVEPYTDYGRIGRLVMLRPLDLYPWHAGMPHVYVAGGTEVGTPDAMGYVPGHIALTDASALLADVTSAAELREALGGASYDDAVADAAARVRRLAGELAATEEVLAPMRRRLQARDSVTAGRARETMARHGISEADLCTAWHHLPERRRAALSMLAVELGAAAHEVLCAR